MIEAHLSQPVSSKQAILGSDGSRHLTLPHPPPPVAGVPGMSYVLLSTAHAFRGIFRDRYNSISLSLYYIHSKGCCIESAVA